MGLRYSMALRKYSDDRWSPRQAFKPRSKFIPITPRNKSVNLVDVTNKPPTISLSNDTMTINWDIINQQVLEASARLNLQQFDRQLLNSVYGTFIYDDTIQTMTYPNFNIDGTPIKYRLNKYKIRECYPQFTWGYSDQLKLIPSEFAQWKSRTKDKVFLFKANFKNNVKQKYNSYKMRWYIRKNKDLIATATTGPVEYDYLKTIKVPTVICYNFKENNSPNKTRVLYPDGFCFVHYRGVLDTCLDWDAGFSRSCFSEGSKSLEYTVDAMKRNDSISQDYQGYTITKTYPYLGPDNKHHNERYR